MIPQKLAIGFSIAVLTLLTACGGGEQVLPAATPEPETKVVSDQEPRHQSLMLRLTSPEVDLITDLDLVSVSGVTSPDATVSVNGRLALPDAQGKFSISLDRPKSGNPMTVEVVASSITGEYESRVRPVIFSDGSGVFGSVTAVTPSKITILTDSGPVTLGYDAATTVRMHGWDSPSAADIAMGTSVAVLADGSRALSVLAVPGRPVRTRHFTGMVAGTGSAGSGFGPSLTLRDDSGRQITATTADGLDPAPVGELVTVVLVQDLSKGSLTVAAFDTAIAGAGRLNEALALTQEVGASESAANRSALRGRLIEHGVRNMSMLVNGRREAVAKTNEFYAILFSQHQIGAPSADVTGLVSTIDSGTGRVTVQPESGPAVMVKLSETTQVAFFGERIRSGQLDLASRVTVRYALSRGDASRITVLAGNALPSGVSAQLALIADRGEVHGTLIEVGTNSATIAILDPATGKRLSLQTAGAVVLWNGSPADLDSYSEGASVFARFSPDSNRLLELEPAEPGTGAPLSGGELVSGVVHSFIPKIVEGNLTIRTPDGRLRAFTHRPETVIRRDGGHVSVNEVQLGDQVRPNTRVRLADTPVGRPTEIVMLSLKAPEPGQITGFIRGVSKGPDGEVRITVSDIWLKLFSLRVGPNTGITREGQALAIPDLAVGQEITQASYDPVTLLAGQLNLGPAKGSARASLAGPAR